MSNVLRIMILAVVSLFIMEGTSFAGTSASITSLTGTVTLKRGDSEKSFIPEIGYKLNEDDRVVVGGSSLVVISYNDKSKVMVKEDSSFTVRYTESSYLSKGRAFFRILKTFARKLKNDPYKFTVGVNNAVVGVKGTTFLVENRDGVASVYLKEGVVNVESISGDFERHTSKQLEEYEDFKNKVESDFDEYKSKMDKEFVEYVKSFDMKSYAAVSISGSLVKDEPFTDVIKSEFEDFEKTIAEMD